jgi:hypothetical protein
MQTPYSVVTAEAGATGPRDEVTGWNEKTPDALLALAWERFRAMGNKSAEDDAAYYGHDNSYNAALAGLQSAHAEAGKKFDSGKPPVYQGFRQYFPRAIEAVANVSAFGATKYSVPYEDQNWARVPAAKFEDSIDRHATAMGRGETYAEDSKLLHLAHRAWNAMATLELALRAGIDERQE